MATLFKVLQEERSKGKWAPKSQETVDELLFLINLNQSITQAKNSGLIGVFNSMANITLLRKDNYLDLFQPEGIQLDTVTALRTAPLQMHSILPDSAIAKAVEENSHYDDNRCFGSSKKSDHYHAYHQTSKKALESDKTSTLLAWEQLSYRSTSKHGRGKASSYSQ